MSLGRWVRQHINATTTMPLTGQKLVRRERGSQEALRNEKGQLKRRGRFSGELAKYVEVSLSAEGNQRVKSPLCIAKY